MSEDVTVVFDEEMPPPGEKLIQGHLSAAQMNFETVRVQWSEVAACWIEVQSGATEETDE